MQAPRRESIFPDNKASEGLTDYLKKQRLLSKLYFRLVNQVKMIARRRVGRLRDGGGILVNPLLKKLRPTKQYTI